MSRFAGSLLVSLALLALTGERAAALSFTGQLSAGGGQPNVINMYLTPGGPTVFSTTAPSFVPFAGTFLDGGVSWSYNVSPDGFFAQLSTLSTPSGPVWWNQGFEQATAPPGGPRIAFSVATQEVQWNYATNTGAIVGGSTTNFSGSGPGNPVTAPAAVQGPVPEPSTLMILGLGALGAAVQARRRRAAQNPT